MIHFLVSLAIWLCFENPTFYFCFFTFNKMRKLIHFLHLQLIIYMYLLMSPLLKTWPAVLLLVFTDFCWCADEMMYVNLPVMGCCNWARCIGIHWAWWKGLVCWLFSCRSYKICQRKWWSFGETMEYQWGMFSSKSFNSCFPQVIMKQFFNLSTFSFLGMGGSWNSASCKSNPLLSGVAVCVCVRERDH